MTNYPPRLIEVDLPIKRISAHARREKSIRHGHISTLHIWWARRPLAACRAVICAALWPDPVDDLCPQVFRDRAADIILAFVSKVTTNERLSASCSAESLGRWLTLKKQGQLDATNPAHLNVLRNALFDFIADFANWDNSTVPEYLETARAMTSAAHEALGGQAGTRPLVVDPFAGGGAIPLEALRVGADAFASDLNPVAVLLNKVVLEYIPKYGQRLADEVRKWGDWIDEQAEKELAEFYPKDPDGATPIAYLWARTITCEGPGCGTEVPLMRSFWLAKKQNRSVAMRLVPDQKLKKIAIEVIEDVDSRSVGSGTVKRGSATCPVCGFTTPLERVRAQLKTRRGGTDDARLVAVVTEHPAEGTLYRAPTETDLRVIESVADRLNANSDLLGILAGPTPTNKSHRAVGSPYIYGMTHWGDLFTQRQQLALTTLSRQVANLPANQVPIEIKVILALCVSKLAGFLSSLCMWRITRTCVAQTFSRQALPQVWDFGEMNPFAGSAGDWSECVRYTCMLIEAVSSTTSISGIAHQADATAHSLPDDSADVFFTDPPYYDSVAYAELSDFFYVWLKMSLGQSLGSLFKDDLTPKENQAIVLHPGSTEEKARYEHMMSLAMSEGRRVLRPDGIGTVVFAHKSTSGWESHLQAMIDAGWAVTASWPIDTERGGRLNAFETASLASSIHLVCRPREKPDGSVNDTAIGDWRDVLTELPKRIHEWMPRLAQEGVVGADAIFACLGPALEIFSRYSRVEKASGEVVTLREYLEQVWGAVAKEALNLIFTGADATGFEEDARLTAMWLWTLSTNVDGGTGEAEQEEETSEDEGAGTSSKLTGGYVLEYDAARKIAQGLGAHLETLTHMVEVKGDKARLLPVSERTRYLFGKDEGKAPTKRVKKAALQLGLFEALDAAAEDEGGWGEKTTPKAGQTVLDRVHQSMILFAAGRSDALKRFLVEDGIGQDQRFWRLAQAFSALYPATSDEKRWVDGVLARKKGLGF
jgi:putative DNA methylase